jgi:cellulose synthase/poly-beta-1,6-N-acetylglucosamine synthase-like glycosyltransferase
MSAFSPRPHEGLIPHPHRARGLPIAHEDVIEMDPARTTAARRHLARFRWWMPSLALGAVSAGLLVYGATSEVGGWFALRSPGWWAVTIALHLPFLVIVLFLVGGLVERFGYFWRGRAPEPPGRLPAEYPTVCVQLPMFNEHAVAQRLIEAATRMTWPADRFSVQVLDDSTDEGTRSLVEAVCARLRASTGVDCSVRHRADRRGYKAGALEEGRQDTDAEFLVIFDADFLPPEDFLLRTIPHFYLPSGAPDRGLALVQAQWGHLNHDESPLTLAQSLWVDDHHTLQMSWRSAAWRFVNFTGTAGVWRASAIESVGGWRAASLVEDCELSFRHLFAGYQTKFVKEIVVPAELPATYTAYKAQQRRWTQGWVQLQRMHLATLLFRFRCSWLRRLHLAYHMCISWQWPVWALWITTLPFLIHTGHWFGASGLGVGLALYVLPSVLWAVTATVLASLETRHTYDDELTPATFRARVARIVPYLVINTGMLPHQLTSFAEGLFGPLHSEFERTPKAASVTRGTTGRPPPVATTRSDTVKVHWPYLLTEAFFVAYQLGWAAVFAANGLIVCAAGALYVAACISYLCFFYGDHVGKVCFVVDRRSPREAVAHAPDCLDHVPAQLASQVADVDVDHVGLGVEVIAPDVRQQLLARQHLVGVAQECLGQGELPPGQLDRPVGHRGPPGAQVQGHVARPQQRGLLRAVGPQPDPDAGQQLLEAERLGHVVVGAAVEPGHRDLDLVPGGQDDDR